MVGLDGAEGIAVLALEEDAALFDHLHLSGAVVTQAARQAFVVFYLSLEDDTRSTLLAYTVWWLAYVRKTAIVVGTLVDLVMCAEQDELWTVVVTARTVRHVWVHTLLSM